MLSMKPCKCQLRSPFTFNPMFQKLKSHTQSFQSHRRQTTKDVDRGRRSRRKLVMVVRGSQSEEEVVNKKDQERKSFLSLEEAGLVEMSGLSTHERFLCRLTISSLNLLRVVSGVPIEKLNAGELCDWFMKDELKREQNLGSAVLQWDDSNLPF
ncbi:hypothetical protein C5167_043102 [Papaver somniferum]|uniref:Uncharacterized protein n=1 Tax=Papaver somniferum TaxID=3469 RepID=A0A4Y7L8E7_PAPSO|nr:hypothetical protein C5167_043102 [Papaver somniferum]